MIETKNKLLILWTSADKEVATKMALMYSLNSKVEQWWDEVNILIWGPSSKLVSEDNEIQEKISEMISAGVRVIACKQCADSYGIGNILAERGIEVFYTGIFLTEWVKERRYLISAVQNNSERMNSGSRLS